MKDKEKNRENRMTTPNKSHNLLLSSLTTYYQKRPSYRKLLYEIIEGLSPLSLRVIDWFVTHYARTHQILYWIDDENGIMYEQYPESGGAHLRKFSLYLDYRAQLKSYTKMYMDSFRRHERITFVLETNPLKTVETTVGQLNFFRWALSNHVIDYVIHHLSDIEANMAQHQKEAKELVRTPSETNSQVKWKTTTSGSGKNTSTSMDTYTTMAAPASNTVVRARCHVRFD